jgi:hypothetical protein
MSEDNSNPRKAACETISSLLGEGVGRRVIGVTGLHGAWLNQVAFRLEKAGALIVWPSQDLALHEARHKHETNGENIELLRMHDLILEECDLPWFGASRPKFFNRPYPGPLEYLDKFPDNDDVVLVDYRLCLFLPLWKDHLTDLVVVTQDVSDVNEALKAWAPASDSEERASVIDNYIESLESDIGLIRKIWYIKNNELKEKPTSFSFFSSQDTQRVSLNSRI